MDEAPIPLITPKPQNIIAKNVIKPKNVKKLNLKSDKNNEFEVQIFIFEDSLFFEGTSKKLFPKKTIKKYTH